MNSGSRSEHERQFTPQEEASAEEQLETFFQSEFTPHPERVGAEGFWIIPAVLTAVAVAWATLKLIF